jgi:putative phage-type endonuclease
MNTEIITPTSREEWLISRTKDVTSTEVAALFGLSPYQTEFELWHRKRNGTIVELEPNERMAWGTRLQDAIANGIAQDRDLRIRPAPEYMRLPDLRMGASFDFFILDENDKPDGHLEIKNVDGLVFKQSWTENDDDEIEAPPHIELQVQQQLAVSGLRYAILGVLVGGNRLVTIHRLPDPAIIEKMKARVVAFWAAVDAGIEPKPNFEQDADFLVSLYGYAAPGSVYDASGDNEIGALVREYIHAGDIAKTYEVRRTQIKAQLLATIGEAEKVVGDGFSISAGVVGPTRVEAFWKKGYRNFRVYEKKAESK